MRAVDRIRQAIQVDTDDCIEWDGCRSALGYGRARYAGRVWNVPQLALIFSGQPRPEPPNHCALHDCDNPPCFNPRHLSWGSARDNGFDVRWRQRSGRKLKAAQVRDIRRRYSRGETQTSIARRFGIDQSTVSSIVRYRVWKLA